MLSVYRLWFLVDWSFYCYVGIGCDFNVGVALCRTRLELLVVSVVALVNIGPLRFG